MQPPDPDSNVPYQLFSEPQPRSRAEQNAKVIEFTTRLVEHRSCSEFYDELTRAELTGELSEFYALLLRAVMGMIEESKRDFVSYYLEMARAVAASLLEQVVAETYRAIYDSLPGDGHAAAQRCLASLEHSLEHRYQIRAATEWSPERAPRVPVCAACAVRYDR